jgi:hypothetical protein
MKTYPTIPKTIRDDLFTYVFSKYDGSNIRAQWTRKNGFDKFGSRHILLDPSHPILGKAIDISKNKYEKSLSDIFQKQKVDKAICFFEFFGPSSFAGNHLDGEQQDVILFDVDIHKKGLLMPSEFLDYFDDKVDIAKLLHTGTVDSAFVDSVKQSTLEGMPFEGVVCKAGNPKRTLQPIMFKIKSNAWLNKLKGFCGEDEKLFIDLA